MANTRREEFIKAMKKRARRTFELNRVEIRGLQQRKEAINYQKDKQESIYNSEIEHILSDECLNMKYEAHSKDRKYVTGCSEQLHELRLTTNDAIWVRPAITNFKTKRIGQFPDARGNTEGHNLLHGCQVDKTRGKIQCKYFPCGYKRPFIDYHHLGIPACNCCSSLDCVTVSSTALVAMRLPTLNIKHKSIFPPMSNSAPIVLLPQLEMESARRPQKNAVMSLFEKEQKVRFIGQSKREKIEQKRPQDWNTYYGKGFPLRRHLKVIRPSKGSWG